MLGRQLTTSRKFGNSLRARTQQRNLFQTSGSGTTTKQQQQLQRRYKLRAAHTVIPQIEVGRVGCCFFFSCVQWCVCLFGCCLALDRTRTIYFTCESNKYVIFVVNRKIISLSNKECCPKIVFCLRVRYLHLVMRICSNWKCLSECHTEYSANGNMKYVNSVRIASFSNNNKYNKTLFVGFAFYSRVRTRKKKTVFTQFT